ncbi:MAG: thioredoxin family protein [Candidatus Bathyarchaeia archaeon]|jgi:peroxiredoxin
MANLKIGDKAIDFTLIGTDGLKHSLTDYRNKFTVVVFSCNHCPYVRAWEGRMVTIQAAYADRGVQLIAVNSNDATQYPEDNFENMKLRAREKQFNFPYLRDEDQKVAESYGAQRTPEVFVFDRNSILRYHGAIDDNYDDPLAVKRHHLRDALDALSGGTKPLRPETQTVGCTIKWKNN